MNLSITVNGLSNNFDIGYTPNQIKKAYGLGSFGNGAGTVVAVIDFLGNNYIQSNLDVFSEKFELPKATVNFFGKSGKGNFEFGAYIEPSADTQWVHAISPQAEIIVVRAESFSVNSAIKAISNAKAFGADIILLTFQDEFSEEYKQYENIFLSDNVFVASAGDYGAGAFFPACFPECVGVGGTSLEIDKFGNRISAETVWQSTGGGICDYFEIPDYQRKMYGISALTNGKRGVPDVSFLANPKNGYSSYHSATNDAFGWYSIGGTSLAAAVTAGLIANFLSNNKNVRPKEILQTLYALAGKTVYKNAYNKYYDVTMGNNTEFQAKKGYDLCTGLGSIINF